MELDIMRSSLKCCVQMLVTLVGIGLTACAGQTAAVPGTVSIEPLGTNTPLAVAQEPTETLVPPQHPTPAGSLKLVVWWPEALAPVDNTSANELLTSQIHAFEVDDGNVQVERRLKKIQGAGGIMSTLRSASAVAPGALPDLTLVRREDLLEAVQAGLIQPLDRWVPSAILGDMTNLSNSILQLGQVDGTLYGVPYGLDALHIAYRSQAGADNDSDMEWTFDAVLAREIPFVFPAGQANPINSTFYVQYLASGGTPPEDGNLTLSTPALRTVLDFYEQARLAGLIDEAVLGYASPLDYETDLVSRTIDAAVVDSTTFLTLSDRLENVQPELVFAPLPTQSGEATTLLNGWLWVMTTTDANQQALAADFLTWMMDADRQGKYLRTVFMLPSQQTALRNWDDTSVDIDRVDEMLGNATLPLAANEAGTVARTMQNALVAVISGERTAQEATQDVIDQISQ
jgi:ABC-type glycerol-3-phosphate transport system substrate-binding protein